MEAYKLFVRKNREFVQSLESLANGITLFFPERFSNSEIGPEAVYAILGVVSAVNQHIIDTGPKPGQQWVPQSAASAFPWSLLVSIVKDVESVVEVAAQHLLGEERKWGFIALAEGVKAIVRLAAFQESGYKMLLQGGEIVNDEKDQNKNLTNNGGSSHNSNNVPKGLEGRAVVALSKFGENAKNGVHRRGPPMPAFVPPKPTLSSMWREKGISSRLFLAGEIIHIIRPVLYVLLIQKYGIKSWKPWLVSIAVDLIGINILSHATGENNDSNNDNNNEEKLYKLSISEMDELKRRKMLLALYVIRDPFFTKHTRDRLEKAGKFLSPIPLIGFFTTKLVELLIGIQTRYTYTSGA